MSEETNYGTETDYKQILGAAYQADDRGAVLADFFEISEKAKEGGMGNVYFCRDKRDNKFYVLKTTPQISGNTDIFRKECLLVLRLWKQPYVAYSKTIVLDKDQFYIVMELVGKQPYNLEESVQGETLTRVMNKTKLEPKQGLIWALQFCQGMLSLNRAGMQTHKDIKPDNILITPENDIKITDFGLASIDNKGGTVGYRSPEYFKKGSKLTIQSDIYSFGLVLYQMLNGGKSLPSATVWDQSKKEYEHININSFHSEHCEEIIRKCLAEDPAARYQNFKELEKDILEYMKIHFPEYVYSAPKAEPMTANDYFLKGLGYYFLKENLWAFLLFSLAIFEDPKLELAYLYRSKVPVLSLAGRMSLLGIIIFIIISIIVVRLPIFSDNFFAGQLQLCYLYGFLGVVWVIYWSAKNFSWNAGKWATFLFVTFSSLMFNSDEKKYKKLISFKH